MIYTDIITKWLQRI